METIECGTIEGHKIVKQPLNEGYNDVIRRAVSNTNLAAGINLLNDTAVPNYEIWIVENIAFWYFGTILATTQLVVSIISGGVTYQLCKMFPASNIMYDRQGNWTLKYGEYMQLYVYGATAGDDAFFTYVGRKISLI